MTKTLHRVEVFDGKGVVVTLRWLIRDGYLRGDGNGAGYFWITRKAAEKYDLPPVLGRAFPC